MPLHVLKLDYFIQFNLKSAVEFLADYSLSIGEDTFCQAELEESIFQDLNQACKCKNRYASRSTCWTLKIVIVLTQVDSKFVILEQGFSTVVHPY